MKHRILAGVLCLASASVLADDVELDMQCEISFNSTVYASGPCKVRVTDNTFTSIKGTNTENGVSFNLIADETKGTALLMGAGTFPLAEGEVQTNVGGVTYRWSNGYTFNTTMP